eukprot:jgi/Antlo1/2325/1249
MHTPTAVTSDIELLFFIFASCLYIHIHKTSTCESNQSPSPKATPHVFECKLACRITQLSVHAASIICTSIMAFRNVFLSCKKLNMKRKR